MIFRIAWLSVCLLLAGSTAVAQVESPAFHLTEAQEAASLSLTDTLNGLGVTVLKKNRPQSEADAYTLLKAAYLSEINVFLKAHPESSDAAKIEMVRGALSFVAMNTRYLTPAYKLSDKMNLFFNRFIETFKAQITFSGQGDALIAV